ncbi:MAG: MmgE/PrpD family protein, partial [Alphaproteobacteria bacterium]
MSRTEFSDLSSGTIESAKTFLADTLGVAVAGSRDALVPDLLEAARGWGAGEEASVWSLGTRLPVPSAAIINAYQIHCLEFDCVHERAVVHPMPAVLAAVMAHAERRAREGRPVGGHAFLLALALGVEVATLIGAAATAPLGFYRSATVGAFGATGALACLESFDPDKTLDAFGAVYGQIAGTLQPHLEGSKVLALQTGFAARAAITACDLAAHGITAPRDVLTGRYGYFELYENGEYELGPEWTHDIEAWQIERLSQKPFACGRLTHGVLAGLDDLQRKHGFVAGEVSSVHVRVPSLVYRLVARPPIADPSPSYARLCIPLVAGMFLARGRIDVADFEPAALRDPDVHRFADRVDVGVVDNPDENAFGPQAVEIVLADGRMFSTEVQYLPGHPEAPLSRRQRLEKFRRCWMSGRADLGAHRGERLAGCIERVEDLGDVSELIALVVPA